MSDSDSVNTIDETVSTKKYGKFNLNANFKFEHQCQYKLGDT